MRNLLFNISYKGTAYHGYQVQKNAHTVACELQNAIERVLTRREDIVGCSRTDTGVHANSYYFNMKTESNIGEDKLAYALNSILPEDIAVLSCKSVDMDFHARYSCVKKEYIYKILNTRIKNPFLEDLALHWRYDMDIDKLNRAASYFVGTYDFRAFCSKSDVEDTVRTIEHCGFHREGDMVIFTVRRNGFLYKMVRTMVGTLLSVSSGRFAPEDIEKIIESKDRSLAGMTAPAHGLYLNCVFYD